MQPSFSSSEYADHPLWRYKFKTLSYFLFLYPLLIRILLYSASKRFFRLLVSNLPYPIGLFFLRKEELNIALVYINRRLLYKYQIDVRDHNFMCNSSFKKNESRLTRSPCLCDCMSPLITFWTSEPVFIKFGMYIMTAETISTAYFIYPSHQSMCLYLCILIVARQRLVKTVTG
jgi:hypothetical protein